MWNSPGGGFVAYSLSTLCCAYWSKWLYGLRIVLFFHAFSVAWHSATAAATAREPTLRHKVAAANVRAIETRGAHTRILRSCQVSLLVLVQVSQRKRKQHLHMLAIRHWARTLERRVRDIMREERRHSSSDPSARALRRGKDCVRGYKDNKRSPKGV